LLACLHTLPAGGGPDAGARGTISAVEEYLDEERDWGAPWAQPVADAREAALLEAEFIPRSENLVATVEWIDESDR
jgi:hypothetical protein